jgi:hypothetical protein
MNISQTLKDPAYISFLLARDGDKQKSLRSLITDHRELLDAELLKSGLMIVPIEPSRAMVQASMATVTNAISPMSKREKHTRRLSAALTAQRLVNGKGKV